MSEKKIAASANNKTTVKEGKPTIKKTAATTDKPVKKTPTTKESKKMAPAKKEASTTAEVKKTKVTAAKKVLTATKKPSASKVETKTKAVAKNKAASAGKNQPTAQERYRMVETAAYFIAERNGFRGDAVAHWIAAEIEIAALLAR